MMNLLIPFLFSLIAGLSTSVGSLFILSFDQLTQQELASLIGFSTGVILYVSFIDLFFSSLQELSFPHANFMFFLGIGLMAGVDFLVPHRYKEEKLSTSDDNSSNMRKTSLVVALGIAIHNFPEGLATFFGTIKSFSLGVLLLVAVTLHNIPEGISITAPIYYATGNKKRAFLLTFLSGVAEPIGAILGCFILYRVCGDVLLNAILAFVAGVMIFISFDELLPISLYRGEAHSSVATLFLGMFAIFLISLIL